MQGEYALKVQPQDAGKRLDLLLSEFFKKLKIGYSRSFIQKTIHKGKVTVENSNRVKSHYKVKTGQEIRVIIEEQKTHQLKAENIPLEIVYEDRDIAVINKPAGLVVHPGPGNYEHTLVNALLYHFRSLSDVNPQRPGIVHRLDKETSGLLVIAKNNFTHHGLTAQFAKHTIKRKYIAIVKGRMEFDEHIIELPIGRHPVKRKKMAVGFGTKTKFARTYYRTLKRAKDSSLLELEPFTGRTHQLRVHLAFVNHPILGDKKYGKDIGFGRLALHARYLGFIHPRIKKFIDISSDIPKEFDDFMYKNKT